MTKLEELKVLAYEQLAFYAYLAIKSVSTEDKADYQKKFGVALCVLEGVGLLDGTDFIILQDMRYSDLERCFKIVNKKAGNFYENQC